MPMRAALILLALLAACGPVSREAAERSCFRQAQLAAKPRGEIAMGATSDGPVARMEIEVSSDYLAGRDPAQLYESCVYRQSGQLPSQPLYSRPDWRN
ncbi:hypothetical protein IQ03_01754 [Gemmobacter caeni]|jgi:hypothetical protein|uniref:Lipoprotein n=2 Tax=Gemmobacter TaxID=204456 RepID=A0A2T6B4M9_9RHOB|nr:hypothetical protein [uncultured Gemmobacter sp.]PTX51038.1 hypothetical protein C8N34_104157 [Gemmobacter caeni]TWJ01038.1 hypothetical protein IQ03_01754 [Gemmobacter caeni]